MADRLDPYKVLQVSPTADDEVIQAAYRALARRYHPDRNEAAGSNERMVEINAAFELIGDPQSRKAYHEALAAEARTPTFSRSTVHQAASAPVPPPPSPSGGSSERTLDFGRYQGWTVRQISQVDRVYLEWLLRVPAGRSFRAEIEALVRPPSPAPSSRPQPAQKRRWFGRS